MQTMHHQYYCKWFYSDKLINEVLGSNYIDSGGDVEELINILKTIEKEHY